MDPSRSWQRTLWITALGTIGAASLATGLAMFLSWMIPFFTAGVLPSSLVAIFRGVDHAAIYDSLVLIHLGLGALLIAVFAVGLLVAYLAWRRRSREETDDATWETATTAFWRWAFGFVSPADRLYRLRFRDALVYPTVEFLFAVGWSFVTFLLILLPWESVWHAGLALHRVNALYVLFLVGYSALVFLLRRRRDSPYPTVIRGGRVVRRPVHYEGAKGD